MEKFEVHNKRRRNEHPMFESSFDRSFAERVEDLIAFQHMCGELPKRGGMRVNGHESVLASFISNQRYAKKKGLLSAARIAMLENVEGFEWNETNSFDILVGKVVAFQNKYGELPRQRGLRDNGEENVLGRFLVEQRRYKKLEILSDARIATLERIDGFLWSVRSLLSFEERVEQIREFEEKYSDLPKLNGLREGYNEKMLASFLATQRKMYKQGQLSRQRISLIESIRRFSFTKHQQTLAKELQVSRRNSIHTVKCEADESRREAVGGGDEVDEASLATFLKHKTTFERNLSMVKAFVAIHDEMPHQDGIRGGVNERMLASFLYNQRLLKRSGGLPTNRVLAMETIEGFQWE